MLTFNTPNTQLQVETAISIAYSCRLFTQYMGVVQLLESDTNSKGKSKPNLQEMDDCGKVRIIRAGLATLSAI